VCKSLQNPVNIDVTGFFYFLNRAHSRMERDILKKEVSIFSKSDGKSTNL